MAEPIKIAAISGSLRKGSYNTSALRAADELAPEHVTLDIMTLHDIPLFNEDVEAKGWPPPVQALRDRISSADAVLFASPEYNYGVSGVLKNGIDWLSRPDGESPLNGKPAGVIGATPSIVGTARAQAQMHDFVFYNAMPLFPFEEVLLFRARDKFDDDGRLVDEKSRKILSKFMAKFTDWIKLIGHRSSA